MLEVHDATMAPIAVGSLAALVGLFTVLDSHDGDRRAALAGLRPTSLLTARLGVLLFVALAATAIALATTALVFHAERWPTYAAANLLIALTYGLIGALLAPIFGRVGGVFIAFLLPFLDLGIAQSAMLHATPTAGSKLLPGYGGSRVLLGGALGGPELGGRPRRGRHRGLPTRHPARAHTTSGGPGSGGPVRRPPRAHPALTRQPAPMLVLLAEPATAVLDRVVDAVSVLTPQEWQRARRFRRPKDREGFIGAPVVVRLCVAALTGGSERSIVIHQRCGHCGGRTVARSFRTWTSRGHTAGAGWGSSL